MICPECGHDIPDAELARHLARKGGATSKRNLSPEEARAMQAKSVAARRRRKKGGKP